MRAQISAVFVFGTLAIVAGACTGEDAPLSGTSDAGPGDATTDTEGVQDTSVPDVQPDSAGVACNPVAQDCPAGFKCTTVRRGNDRYTGCVVPQAPNKMLGDACTQFSGGDDDCVKGLRCIPDGSKTLFFCRQFCGKDADCNDSKLKCTASTNMGTTYGVCLLPCTPFGTDCPVNRTCGDAFPSVDLQSIFNVCRDVGQNAVGNACAVGSDCVADTNCQGNPFKCTPQCDSIHPCGAGTCAPRAGLPNAGGLCE